MQEQVATCGLSGFFGWQALVHGALNTQPVSLCPLTLTRHRGSLLSPFRGRGEMSHLVMAG
jgi:hypothetical protein